MTPPLTPEGYSVMVDVQEAAENGALVTLRFHSGRTALGHLKPHATDPELYTLATPAPAFTRQVAPAVIRDVHPEDVEAVIYE